MSPPRAPLPPPLVDLLALPRFGTGVGLHRAEELTEELAADPWWSQLIALKVAGSKGKGSVATMAAAILTALGLRCGLYTSPHLRTFGERIQVDGERIRQADLAAAAAWVSARCARYKARHPGDEIGAFEAFTALALRHFHLADIRALVAEAGIGGRYDPTRILPGRITALTSVEAEHTKLLGPSPELIAYDKADLCPEGGTLVLGEVAADLERRLAAYCRLRRVRMVPVAGSYRVASMAAEAGVMKVDLDLGGLAIPEVEVGLLGRHQAANAAVAARLVWEWVRSEGSEALAGRFEAAVRRGLAAVELPGRLQMLRAEPPVFADVAHTPGAAAALAEAVGTALPGRPILLLLGVSHDKDVAGVVAGVLPVARAVVCTRAHHKGAALAALEALVRRERPDLPVVVAEPLGAAVATALETAAARGMTVLVTGSLYLVAETMEVLAGRDPGQLRFA